MFTLNCNGRLLVIEEPIVMGIINATPDSFYSSSRQLAVDDALKQAEKMLQEGATILDIGGQSTRPGSKPLNAEEELARVTPIIEAIANQFPDAFISIDTYHSLVAKKAVSSGACIVNDISGGTFDSLMLTTIGVLRVPYICMHLKGTVDTMHQKPTYVDVMEEVLDYFILRLAACSQAGIIDTIIDPGFGFSKNSEHNFSILKNLEVFKILRKPLLLGVSRKSTIYKTLGIPVENSLNGTTVLNTAGLLKGATILRVHDVKEAMEAIKLTQYLK